MSLAKHEYYFLSDLLQRSVLLKLYFSFVVAESDFEAFLEIQSRGFITFIHERLAHIRKPFSIILGQKWKEKTLAVKIIFLVSGALVFGATYWLLVYRKFKTSLKLH